MEDRVLTGSRIARVLSLGLYLSFSPDLSVSSLCFISHSPDLISLSLSHSLPSQLSLFVSHLSISLSMGLARRRTEKGSRKK
jgi:hypothetical protein